MNLFYISTSINAIGSRASWGHLKKGNLRGNTAFVDFQGKLIIPPHFSDVGFFSEGLASVCTVGTGDTQGERWGYINREGEFEIPAQFYAAKDFSEQLAAVVRQDPREWVYINEKWGDFIRLTGGAPASFL
jgi:hypothetical protein